MSELRADNATETSSLRTLITAQAGQALSTDDVILLVQPLFEQVAALHAHGKVAILEPDATCIGEAGGLCLTKPEGEPPRMEIDTVRRVQPHAGSGLNIVGALQSQHHEDGRQQVT